MDDELTLEEIKIWEQDEDPSFEELRANMETEESVVPEEPEIFEEGEEDETEDTEQPEDEDSAEDSDIDTEETEDDDTDSEEVDEDQPDDEDVEESEDETEPEVQTFTIKANGMSFDLTQDELLALAPKAMDYTKKMQEIAPWRKSISAMKEAGLSQDDLNRAIDVLKGDKNAIIDVIKQHNLDVMELDTEDGQHTYTPNQYGKSDVELNIEDVVSQISGDPEYAMTTQVVDNTWDGMSRQALAKNPSMIMGLHNDIKTGVYANVAPLAYKLKALDGGQRSDIEYYIEAGKEYFKSQNGQGNMTQEPVIVNKAEESAQKQKTVKDASKKRKAGGITRSNAGKRDVVDYLDDADDSKFNDWYDNLMKSV